MENKILKNGHKVCPWCGHEVAVKKYMPEYTFRAICSNWLCPVEGFKCSSEEEALRWWDSRPD